MLTGSQGIGGTSSLVPGVSDGRYFARQTAAMPFPWKYRAKLSYGVNIALGTAGSSPLASIHALSLNNVYDPDVTGTGEQPYFYDTLTAIYRKYIVRSAYIDLTFTDPSADGLWVGWSLGAVNSGDDPVNKTLGDIMSRPTFRCVPINNTGSQFITIRERVPLHTVFGLTEQQYMSQPLDYGAAYNASPSLQAFVRLFIVDPNQLLSAQYVRVAGRITYEVDFYDYLAPGGS
jgi:hypothetical protein